MLSFPQTIDLLRAVAEPTRYRLLCLLKCGELTVGEIAEVLDQSQPRISRHLKLLSDVAALERFREEQRIYYRLITVGRAGNVVAQLLAPVDVDDAMLKQDRERLAAVLDKRVRNASARWEDVRRSAETTYSDAQVANAVIKEIGSQPLGELLDIGTGSGSMLRILADRATHAVGLDLSTQALRVARAKVHGAGLSHCLFQRGDMYALPFEAASFDVVTLDHVLSSAERPLAAINEAVRVLRRGGRLIIVDDNVLFAAAADDKPQIALRRWLTRTGLRCNKLKLLRAGKRQLLFALAQR